MAPLIPSNAVQRRRAEAFDRLDALPHEALRGLPYPRIASMAMATEAFVRDWIELRGHTDLLRHNPVVRDGVFARLDALSIEQIRGLSLYGISRLARTSIPYVRTWAAARGLGKIVGYDQDRWLIELYEQTPRLRYREIAARMRLPYKTVSQRINALQEAGELQRRSRVATETTCG